MLKRCSLKYREYQGRVLTRAAGVPLNDLLHSRGGNDKQGGIHGNPVADGWAGAVMQKPLGIQKCDGPTDRPTDRHGKV